MHALVDAALNDRWGRVAVNQLFATPDNSFGSNFTVTSVSAAAFTIRTGGGTTIELHRTAFAAALAYLLENNHFGLQAPCRIASDKDIQKAGPLCVAVRNANGPNIMVVTYVVPILAVMGLVQVDGARPNTVWLV